MNRYGADSPNVFPGSPRREYANMPQPPYFSPPPAPLAYRINAPSALYAGDWGANDKIVLGSYSEDQNNSILLSKPRAYSPGQFDVISQFSVTFPPSKLMFNQLGTRVLSASDALRLFSAETSLELQARYARAGPTIAPLTSFDWNKLDENLAITASIDTTCTLWDLTQQSVKTQLIAHDKAVYDVQFVPQTQSQFVSAGADGSARLFDLRALDNSTIIYEQRTPLLRLGVSPYNANLLFALAQESAEVFVLDIRSVRNPVNVLKGHKSSVNTGQWLPPLPNAQACLATGGDDCQVLVWDVNTGTVIKTFQDEFQINNLVKSPNAEWLGCVCGKYMQAVSTRAR